MSEIEQWRTMADTTEGMRLARDTKGFSVEYVGRAIDAALAKARRDALEEASVLLDDRAIHAQYRDAQVYDSLTSAAVAIRALGGEWMSTREAKGTLEESDPRGYEAQTKRELRAEVERLRKENSLSGDIIAAANRHIAELESRPCPHVYSSDEGTQHCTLAQADADRVRELEQILTDQNQSKRGENE